ncbi:hypothetical protein [Paenibacillus sp. MABNR03]|uniref:hypothetical protein n=1 Tax=Paenibacillus sp. MABNR03 TaxID=3142626 RepID=UPI003D2C1442
MIQQRKPIGLGTFSLLVIALGFAFNYAWGPEDFRFSYYLFHQMNWPIYSNGNDGLHLPFVATAFFWVPAVVIARKYDYHYGTRVAFNVARFMLIFCILGPLVLVLNWIIHS